MYERFGGHCWTALILLGTDQATSAVPLPIVGPGGPTVRVGLPPPELRQLTTTTATRLRQQAQRSCRLKYRSRIAPAGPLAGH